MFDSHKKLAIISFFRVIAHVAELVDAHGSGPCAARCGGSSPSVGTRFSATQFFRVQHLTRLNIMFKRVFCCTSPYVALTPPSRWIIRISCLPASPDRLWH